jgi:hypothetical protein
MSCNNTNARLQIKYTTIAGQVPTIPSTNDHNDGTWNSTDIYIGEFFLNSEDNLLWVRTLDGILPVGGTGGSASFIGDFVSKANGGTYSGPVFAPTFSAISMIANTISASAFDGIIFGSSASTYYGDGSNLTGITTNWNGGTVSDPTQFDNTVDFNQDISVNNVYSGTLGYIDIHSDVTVNGGLSASYFVGDGSLLTNLPMGPTANYYTTNSYLDGNIIRFDRTDLADAYSVDLSPILFTYSIASFDWNSSLNEATIFINDGSFFTINLNVFDNISTAIINATDVYATNFYGTFNGTYSNDIYTISATLSGTTAVFDRTDGSTYSLDLSTLSGGGSASNLEQTLSIGNTTGTYSILAPNNSGLSNYNGVQGSKGITFDNDAVIMYAGTSSFDDGGPLGFVSVLNADGTISTQTQANVEYNMDYFGNGSGHFSVSGYTGFKGIEYASDYSGSYSVRSLVDKEYVDNAVGASSTLEQTLILGNTTGTQSIFISSSASQIQGYNGINQHWYDAGAPFVGLGDYYQIENNSGGGETQSYIRFYDEGDTMIENNEKYDTINSPANQDAKKTRLWLRPQTIRFNADNQDFDTNTFNLGSEMTINADAFNHETHDVLNDCTAQIVASTDGTGTYTAVSLQAYHYGGASASKLVVAHDYITNRVDANVGTGTGPFTLIEQTYTDIIVSGTTSFPGAQYDIDYSANYTNRSLVDKEYVDNASGSFVYITENTTTGTLTMSAPTSITSTVTDGISDTVETIITPSQVETTSTNGTKTSTETITPVSMTSMITDGIFTQSIYIDSQASKNVIEYIDGTDITRITTQDTGSNGEINMLVTDGTNTSNTQQKIDFITSYVYDSNADIADTISLDPQGLGDGTGIISYDNTNEIYSKTTYTPTQIINNVSDDGFQMASSKAIRTNPQGNIHQTMFSNNPSVKIIEDKKGYWTQTSDATTTLIAHTDVDPFIIGSYTASVVQVKAKVRGILDDKTLGYAAEIISWVRLNVGSITQIGTVDYTIKSEFTTAASSFVISGPNMYIDVTGEAGSTIDWTCSLEIIYDVNAL